MVVRVGMIVSVVCSTGWWLSMKPEDQFLKKLQPLADRYKKSLGDEERFGTYNHKTIGFLLVSCVYRTYNHTTIGFLLVSCHWNM